MRVIDMSDWKEEQRQEIHQQWMNGIGMSYGPMDKAMLDEIIEEVDLDKVFAPVTAAIPGAELIGYYYADEDGASIRIGIGRAVTDDTHDDNDIDT
jgi:hypothetical protein